MCEKVKTVTEKINEALALDKNTVAETREKLILDCVGKVRILNENGGFEEVDAFKESAKIVFDSTSKNFHVSPTTEWFEKGKENANLNNELLKRQNLVYDCYKNDRYGKLIKGNGKVSGFAGGAMFKCLYIKGCNGKNYYLNFMRFHQTEEGKVNCDFKSLQYDCVVSGGSVNATADANVCDVCYPYSSANGECHVNSVGNICYNPYISFYDDEELILKDFINFIECCDKLINHNNNSINEKYNDGFISSQQFADILRKSITPTPLTKAFEKTSLAQNKNRWWDNSTGEQKEHLVCWFSRKFNGGSTEECMKNNLGSNCENCYFSKIEKKPSGFGEQIDAQLVFERMGRPEMYFHIAESLGVLERNQLEKFIEEVKVNIDNWRNIRKKYLSWDMVRNKVLEELKNE